MGYPALIYADTGVALDIGLYGGALASGGHAEGTYRTNPHEPTKEDAMFTFPGTDLVFNHHLGMRTRIIDWWGSMAFSDYGLAVVRANRDAAMFASGTWTFVDDDGATYYACLLRSFEFAQKQRIQARGSLVWHVGYRIVLEQLQP